MSLNTVPTAPDQRRLPRSFRYMQPMQRGDDVRLLQDMLRRADPDGAGREIAVIDGLFGPAMRRAAMAFQAKAGMPEVDGVVGPDTWAALLMALDAGSTQRATTPEARATLDAAVAQSRRENGAAGVLARSLPALRQFHAVFEGGARWRLTPQGVEVEGRPLPGQSGNPLAVRRAFEWFGPELRSVAVQTEVPIELLAATICTEVLGATSRYATRDAAARAVREEPGYSSDEATPHRVSPGLAQTLISTAQQMMPGIRVTRALLFEPMQALRAGALYIRAQAPQTRLDPPSVACAYNAGGMYLQTGPRNHWRMRQYPIGTPDHADRFVIFFNQILRVAAAEPALLGGAEVPSLFRALAA